MAVKNATIFIKIVTYDPVKDAMVPLPGAELKLKDQGPLKAKIVTDQPIAANAQGELQVALSFDDAAEPGLFPSFTIKLTEAGKKLLTHAGAPLELPDSWETAHEERKAKISIPQHTTAQSALQLIVGLPAHLQLSYSDFHESRKRNPMAVPANFLRVSLADEDFTGCWRWLNSEDTLIGKGTGPGAKTIVDIGQSDRYPYLQPAWPMEPYHEQKHVDAGEVRAWSDPPGAPVASLGGDSFSQLGPMAVDDSGFVFMVDFSHVKRFYPDGTIADALGVRSALFPQFADPEDSGFHNIGEGDCSGATGLALDRERTLFVAVAIPGNIGINIYRPKGGITLDRDAPNYAFKQKFNTWSGPEVDELHMPVEQHTVQPRALAIIRAISGPEYLVLADQGFANGTARGVTIFRIEPDRYKLEYEAFIGGKDEANQPIFTELAGLAADRDGNLYIADKGAHRIWRWRFEPGGKLTAMGFWGLENKKSGSGANAFNGPETLAMDLKNHLVYVVDRGNKRILRLDATSGTTLFEWKPVDDPRYLAVDPRGDLYLAVEAAQEDDRQVKRFTVYDRPAGTAREQSAAPVAYGPVWRRFTHAGHMRIPVYLHFDGQDRLWVADTGNDRVLVFSRNGDGVLVADPDIKPSDSISGMRGLTTDHEGRLYVVQDSPARILRYEPPAYGQATVITGSGFTRPHGIAFHLKGEDPLLYVAELGGNRVQVLKTDGTAVAMLVPPGGTSFKKPADVAVDSQGNIYVTDMGNKRLLRLAGDKPLSEPMREISVELPKTSGTSLSQVAGVSVDGQNHVYLTDREQHRVIHLDDKGRLAGWWDLENLLKLSLRGDERAEHNGVVSLKPKNNRQPTQTYYAKDAWLVTKELELTLTEKDGTAHKMTVPEGSILLVDDNQKVEKEDSLFAPTRLTINEPELARMITLNRPWRAVVDKTGLLAVADTGNHRVRLLQTRSHMRANLFELNERFPDATIHISTESDWLAGLGLNGKVGEDVGCSGSPIHWFTDAEKDGTLDYAQDRFDRHLLLGDGNNLNAAVNALNVIYQVQRWMVNLTREDSPQQRWFAKTDHAVLADIGMSVTWSNHPFYRDVIYLAMDTSGRGSDAWDDDVIAHELGHWVFDRSAEKNQLNPIKALYKSDKHYRDEIIHQGIALIEGYAEYQECFWRDYGDRVRGSALTTLNKVWRYDNETDKNRLKQEAFDSPGSNRPVEGYLANSLYQLHQTLIQPGLLFADHPGYWYAFNSFPSVAMSKRYTAIFREAFRLLPADLGGEDLKQVVFVFLSKLRQALTALLPGLIPAFRAILELNNLVMPQMTVTATDQNFQALPGSPPTVIKMKAGESRFFLVRLRDAWQEALAGFNLNFNRDGDDPALGLSTSGVGAPFQNGAVAAKGVNRTTDAEGAVRVTFKAPAVAGPTEVSLAFQYQPDFHTNVAFAPPQRGDDLETCERKLYLHALRLSTANLFDRLTNRTGALLKHIQLIHIDP